jgi:hypothetical protein
MRQEAVLMGRPFETVLGFHHIEAAYVGHDLESDAQLAGTPGRLFLVIVKLRYTHR